MNIREFNYHQHLASLGFTKPITCFNELDHGPLHANVEGPEDSVYLYCLGCDFKLYPGSEFSKLIKNKILDVMNRIVEDDVKQLFASRKLS